MPASSRKNVVRGSHYHTLGVPVGASPQEIKQAYRRLVKEHHPDTSREESDRIREINAAYHVLKHRDTRSAYDRQIQAAQRETSNVNVGQPQATVTDEAVARHRWIQQVYTPLNRTLASLLNSLKPQLNALAADPFDPELTNAFEIYLQNAGDQLSKAQTQFRQSPNPSSLAGVASRLYYALNHLEDGLDELNYFTMNFDDRHLHTGQELFHRARGLRSEAMEALKSSAL
ncbi:MAG: DnaJ domain-containing protein [Synechococcaceae cyanobacterium SM2_3_1]|nr:DnaJ domain-containing protein [Synechococcaceae cyanobacterium SM2_3_1]